MEGTWGVGGGVKMNPASEVSLCRGGGGGGVAGSLGVTATLVLPPAALKKSPGPWKVRLKRVFPPPPNKSTFMGHDSGE